MSERHKAIAEVSHYCDLDERLTLVPPSAKARGVYFRSIEGALAAVGKSDEYRSLFPEKFAAVAWHPASEFLVRLAVGGAMLAGPARVHDGMFQIGRRNATIFAESLVGRMLLRFLSHDPRKLLQQGAAGRRQGCSYGNWEMSFPSEQTAVVKMTEEYMYIESYHLGGAQGTFDAIGVPLKAEAVLEDRFCGTHFLSW